MQCSGNGVNVLLQRKNQKKLVAHRRGAKGQTFMIRERDHILCPTLHRRWGSWVPAVIVVVLVAAGILLDGGGGLGGGGVGLTLLDWGGLIDPGRSLDPWCWGLEGLEGYCCCRLCELTSVMNNKNAVIATNVKSLLLFSLIWWTGLGDLGGAAGALLWGPDIILKD